MQATQLELKLWEDLEQASATPETADLVQLWRELETAIGPLPHEQRLQTAGKAIAQIVDVLALRSDFLLSAWEDAHSGEGPAVDEDAIASLVRQTMILNLSELIELPAPEHRQRQPHAPSTNSVAGEVDKAALLKAFDSEIGLVEAQAQGQSAAMAGAHDEDVAGWSGAIARWLEHNSNREAVSLLQLQRGLEMSLVEVWLGLLLSQQQPYHLEQRGEFYEPQGIRVQIS